MFFVHPTKNAPLSECILLFVGEFLEEIVETFVLLEIALVYSDKLIA